MTEQNQTGAPPTETEDERIRRIVDEKLREVTGQDISVSLPGDPGHPETIELSDVLDAIDPRDSESAIQLFGWLVDNNRLQRVATLTQGGYLFVYQEPEGSSKQGWTAGGTTGDRVVDDALDQAKEQGAGRAVKGLCKHCLSAIQKIGEQSIVAENPRPGDDPAVCDKAPDSKHEFAG